jgi:hypothetical protein
VRALAIGVHPSGDFCHAFDDAEAFAAEILAQDKKEHAISALFQGAHYCPMEFNGNVDEID